MLQKTVIKIKLTKGLIVVIIDTSIKFSLTDVSECAQSGLCLYDSIIIIVRFCLERLRHSWSLLQCFLVYITSDLLKFKCGC